MVNDTVLILDCGASHFGAAVVSLNRRHRLTLERVHLDTFDPQIAGGDELTPQAHEALVRVVKSIGRQGAAVLAVPCPLVTIKSWETPDLSVAHRDKALRFEAQQSLPSGQGELSWDVRVTPCGDKRLQVTLVSAPTVRLEEMCSAIDSMGVRVQRILPVALVLEQHLGLNAGAFDGATLLVDIGARTTHLSYGEHGRTQVRAIALGGNRVTRAVADDLGISFEEAECRKHQYAVARERATEASQTDSPESRTDKQQVRADDGDVRPSNADRMGFGRAFDLFLSRLQLEITRALVNQRTPGRDVPATRILLTGGGALLPGLAAALESRLNLPVLLLNPLAAVEVSPECDLRRDEDAPRLAVLVATAAAHFFERGSSLNLLPSGRIKAERIRKRQPALLGAATMAALALVPPLTSYQNAQVAMEQRVREADVVVKSLSDLKRRNETNLARIAAAHEEITLFRRLAASRGNWVRFFSELQLKLSAVEDVWLDRIQYLKPTAAASNASPARFVLAGRLLETEPSTIEGATSAEVRVRDLLAKIARSPFVAALEYERFDRAEAGILGFEVTVRMNQSETL